MVTELVGHHVVNSRPAKLGPVRSHPNTHSACCHEPVRTDRDYLRCSRGDSVSLTLLARAGCAIALPAIITLPVR
jgi:hypothetical protein